jgi:hypothetical protein
MCCQLTHLVVWAVFVVEPVASTLRHQSDILVVYLAQHTGVNLGGKSITILLTHLCRWDILRLKARKRGAAPQHDLNITPRRCGIAWTAFRSFILEFDARIPPSAVKSSILVCSFTLWNDLLALRAPETRCRLILPFTARRLACIAHTWNICVICTKCVEFHLLTFV